MIVADINELYRQRFLELFPSTNRIQYWKTSAPTADLFDEGRIARENELRGEKREFLRTLLGSDYSDEDDLSAIQLDSYSERTLDFLTPEKRTAVKELDDRFTVKMMQTYKSTWRGDEGLAEEVRAEKDDALLKVLSREEKFEYDLRKSDTAQYLRFGLGGFEVSEQEFRRVFPGMKQFITDAGIQSLMHVVRGDGDPREITRPARAQLEARLKSALGEKRFADLIKGAGWNLLRE